MGYKQKKKRKAAAAAAAAAAAIAAARAAATAAAIAAAKDAANSAVAAVDKYIARANEAADAAWEAADEAADEAFENMFPRLVWMMSSSRQRWDHVYAADDDVDYDPQVGAMLLRSNKQALGEKKARRLLSKLDLKPVENVSRVTMRKNKNILLYIDQPDVFKVGDSYLCFGEVKVEDITNTAAAQIAERYRQNAAAADQSEREGLARAPALENDQEEPELDEALVNELDDKDVLQSGCRSLLLQALLNVCVHEASED